MKISLVYNWIMLGISANCVPKTHLRAPKTGVTPPPPRGVPLLLGKPEKVWAHGVGLWSFRDFGPCKPTPHTWDEQTFVRIPRGKLHNGNNSLHSAKELMFGMRMWMDEERGCFEERATLRQL